MRYNNHMLVLRNRLEGVPLMSLQTGTQIGTTAEPIIDPRNLTIVAFYCEGPGVLFSPAVLHVDDIREFSDLGFIVDNSDVIMPTDDLVRLHEILAFRFELAGKQVVQDNGQKLGKVSDYAVDADSFYIMKLHLQPTFLQSLTTAEHIIDRKQIKSIDDKHIVVNSAAIKDSQKVTHQTNGRLDNPFRKRQAEAADLNRANK